MEGLKPGEAPTGAPSTEATGDAVALCVDLDGTLIRTDLFIESLFSLLRRNVFYVFLVAGWLLRGKAAVKAQVARRVDVDPATLPYHAPLLTFLRRQRAEGRRLVLASAASDNYVSAVAKHLGLFDVALGSTRAVNLSGARKLDAIRTALGNQPFDYAANGKADLAIWSEARQAILVDPAPGVAEAVRRLGKPATVFGDSAKSWKPYVKTLRLRHWLKNLMLFVPLTVAHKVADMSLVVDAILAFVAFGVCASSAYVINDLVDLPHDREHPMKARRPFASGEIPLLHGLFLAPVLLLAASGISALLPLEFTLMLLFYFATTLAYSFRLKRVIVLDVLTLAGLYTIRIIAGGAAVSIELSFWLLAFSMFIFLSLALVKRHSELLRVRETGQTDSPGRGYRAEDLSILAQLGTSSGLLSVLVLALYVNSEQVVKLYTRPFVIWLLCPMILYWLGRLWVLAGRGEVHEDPIVFATLDRRTYVLGILALVVLLMAV